MATTKKHRRRRSSIHQQNAGTRRRRSKPGQRRHRPNPGFGSIGTPKDWISGGAGVIVGVVGTRGLPQLLLGTNNTGAMGYAANLASTGILTFLAHLAMPNNKIFKLTVLSGGLGALFSRVIGDYSLLGSYSSQVGLGDYLFNFNFQTPQQLDGSRRALVAGNGPSPTSSAVPINVGGASSAGMAIYGPNLY